MEHQSQHFLLSKKARSLSLKRIYCLSDEQAFAEFVAIRFAENDGKAFCPQCGCAKVYEITTRNTWKCAARECRTTFSATSHTIFKDRKLPFRELLLAIAFFVLEPKGISAIRLSHKLEISYKSAFVLAHKLREVLITEQQCKFLAGEVEVDGGYFGGYIKPGNEHPSRRGRRRLNRNPKKQMCVVVTRERWGNSRAMICSEVEGAERLPEFVDPDSFIFTDKFSGSARISAKFKHFRVNHSQQYADGWISTNWAESYFSRLRRFEIGTHHHVAGPYLLSYANEACWREDRRRHTNEEDYQELLKLAGQHPVSRQWKGYWQRRKEVA